jgi:hypothetical protein
MAHHFFLFPELNCLNRTGQNPVNSEMIKKIDAIIILNYADEICDMEKTNNIFAPIENAELRGKIQKDFTLKSKELCAQRTGARILETLKFKKIDEKSANPVAGTALESVVNDVNKSEKYFDEKIAKFVDEENKKFRIRKARQV